MAAGGRLLLLAAVAVAFAVAASLPAPAPAPSPSPSSEDLVYDQRQNGSENLRLHMSDVSVVLAPAELLLSADLLPDQALPKPKQSRTRARLPGLLFNLLSGRHDNY